VAEKKILILLAVIRQYSVCFVAGIERSGSKKGLLLQKLNSDRQLAYIYNMKILDKGEES